MTGAPLDLGLGTVRILPPDLPPAARAGQDYGPPAGLLELRRALARAEGVHPDEVALTTGASMALTALLAGLPKPCSILCPRPHYPAYVTIAGLLGIDVIFYDLGPLGGQPLDADRLRRSVRPDTRAVLVNCPGNPAGNILDASSCEVLAGLARQFDLLVLSDDVYADFTYEIPVPDLRRTFGPDRTVRIRSFSKAHGLPGERLGYVVAPADIVERVVAAHWALAMSPPATAQLLALSILGRDHAARSTALRRDLASARSDAVELLGRSRCIRCKAPQAGIFLWMEVVDSGMNSVELASICAVRAGVAVVPGAHFGVSTRAFLRASFAWPWNDVREGLTRLVEVIDGATHA